MEVATQSQASPETQPGAGVNVSIIIANYNTRALLERNLASIYAHPPHHSFEVLVVDDASRDDSVEMVRQRFSRVRLYVNPRNLGYARSNNHMIAESKGRFIYLLNSDAELLPGAVDTLVDFLEAHLEVGGVGSLLYNDDGSVQESVKSLPSVRSAFVGKRSFLRKWIPRSWWARAELLQWKAESGAPFQAGYVSSASLMMPRQVVQEVGDLDTRLWYFIDADYCKRIWNTGRTVYCVPTAKAIHREHRGGTLTGWRQRFRSLVTFHYGAYIYFRKHSGKPLWHPMYALVILCLSARFLASLVFQTIKEFIAKDRRIYDHAFHPPA